jgi:hypothetical protein
MRRSAAGTLRSMAPFLKFAAFLGGTLLVLVVLALGPFREHFFPSQYASLSALVQLDPIELHWESYLEENDVVGPIQSKLLQLLAQEDYRTLTHELEIRSQQTRSGEQLLAAYAYLKQRRPSGAIVVLERKTPANESLAVHSLRQWFLAQSYLMLGHAEDANSTLQVLAKDSGPLLQPALAQLLSLQTVSQP